MDNLLLEKLRVTNPCYKCHLLGIKRKLGQKKALVKGSQVMRFNDERSQKYFHRSPLHRTDECHEIMKIFWLCEWHKNLMSDDIRTVLGIFTVSKCHETFYPSFTMR